jgi:hypothetical protein
MTDAFLHLENHRLWAAELHRDARRAALAARVRSSRRAERRAERALATAPARPQVLPAR